MADGASEAIHVSGLSKWFGAFRALSEIDLSIERGRCLVLCGPSGSGKSTLLRCLNGLEEWDAGEIRLGREAVGHRTGELVALRRRVGMVFQSFNLFPHLTVLDNVALAPRVNLRTPRESAEARAAELLRSVGLAGYETKMPRELSGGQQQRVAIARALAMNPEVLLFDEPTSALDPESIGGVLQLMTQLAERGCTMVVVTHEMGFARRVCHNVIFMARGRVVENAPPDEFFEDPKTERAKAFLTQVRHA